MDDKKHTNPLYHHEESWKSDNFIEWEKKQGDKFKEYRKKWTEAPTERKAPSFPMSVNLEITTKCNFHMKRCIMCPYENIEKVDMATEDVKKIIDNVAEMGAYAINLNGAGEPLLHPDIIDIVKYAKDKGIIDIMFHTNGLLLNESKAKALIEAGLTKLIVSVDAPIAETYEKIRPASNFDLVYKNVKRFVELRNEMGKNEPIVRITMVVIRNEEKGIDNTVQISKAKEVWNFVDQITINDCMYFDDYKAFKLDKEKVLAEAKEKGLTYICAPLYQQLSVSVHKNVSACSAEYAETHAQLGNLDEVSLKEIWEGEKLAELRKAHECGNCKGVIPCSMCELPEVELLKQLRGHKGVLIDDDSR